jgi:programmed cell death 6-interacting protein
MDILDHEVSEDEAARKGGPIGRPPSHEANEALVKKEKRYRSILERAAASDELVIRKWDQWEANIRELTWDEVSSSMVAAGYVS